jgi:RNA polymerase primary sigma factor
MPDEHQEIINKLYSSYKSKGYITEDETLKLFSENQISLINTDRLMGKLLNIGVIFYSQSVQYDDNYSDYGFVNYEEIYSEIFTIDNKLEHLINYIRNIKPPQKHEFKNLYKQYKSGNNFAKVRILEMNMRQALYFSKKYLYPLEECIQDALLGLVLGLEKYEPSKSPKFQIHIIWWIRQNLFRYIKLGNYLLNYPIHIKELLFKVFFLFNKNDDSYIYINKKTIIKKICNILSCAEDKANVIYNCFQKYINIDNITLLNDHNEYEYNLMNDITNTIINRHIKDTLSTLPLKEQIIVKKRYGIDIEEPLTLEIVGEQLGLTRERIRQIEAKAFRRLRHPKRSKNLLKLFEYDVIQTKMKDL